MTPTTTGPRLVIPARASGTGFRGGRPPARVSVPEGLQLGREIGPSPFLPGRGTVRRTEQPFQVEELAQYGGPARPEGVVRDEAVLLPYGTGVRRVRLRLRRQDREIRVTQHLAVVVAGRGIVGDGEPDEPGDLLRHAGPHARLGERAHREDGAALLVLGALGPVDGVVEPGGETDGLGVVGVRGEGVDVLQDGEEMIRGVVAAPGLGPPGQQVLGVGRRVGGVAVAYGAEGAQPAGAQTAVVARVVLGDAVAGGAVNRCRTCHGRRA